MGFIVSENDAVVIPAFGVVRDNVGGNMYPLPLETKSTSVILPLRSVATACAGIPHSSSGSENINSGDSS